MPANSDALALVDAMRLVFADVEHDRDARTLRLRSPLPPGTVEWSAELVSRSRNLYCLIPATLHHRGRLRFAGVPAGCEIGLRPTQWYLDTLALFGATWRATEHGTDVEWTVRRPARVAFAYPSMTGTVVAVAAALATPGASVVEGATAEPSCWEQVEALAANGADVHRVGDRITVTGPGPDTVRWAVGPDRIHAVTLLTAGLLTRGAVTVRFTRDLRVPRFVELCERIGAEVEVGDGTMTVAHPGDRALRATDVRAGSEPVFSSDWAPFAALLLATRAEGRSTLTDTVFVDRFQFLDRLVPAGLDAPVVSRTHVEGRPAVEVVVDGRPDVRLRGGVLEDCPDIRGSAALLLAALVADGPVTIPRATHLLRGYEDLPGQLRQLGVTAAHHLEVVR
ncbi:hypothetical protein Cch01nite_13260 [Cellulomonas chitinilytica]|uniref:UDP-N-acetylglucosamine 1-carboxyvinyltransferase n=1 Tax=Cellulomonas chitinilytica TaxID=398759 RepID=A0A919U1K8_9CELL|nr:hypothetical protein Cch01nite_13260 [Cellulomonas chitinilytica]